VARRADGLYKNVNFSLPYRYNIIGLITKAFKREKKCVYFKTIGKNENTIVIKYYKSYICLTLNGNEK
jgi:hypothetical protein